MKIKVTITGTIDVPDSWADGNCGELRTAEYRYNDQLTAEDALGELAELGGREAGLLDHERQRPLLLVAIDDDEGDALAVDVGTHGDEVARTAAAGNLTILDDEAISVVGELFLG